MMERNFLKRILTDQRGTTAVEFAIVGPVFMLMLIGTFAVCTGLFLVGSLHYAVEEGARCASVKTTICSDSATTVAYTQSHYLGPNLSPVFSYSKAACGNSVSATISFALDTGLKTYTVPLSATACFPENLLPPPGS
jgi:Flp pilus assembly pilin Flp